MRSKVVSLRDMAHKYKAEVKSFPYAFVLSGHFPGWEQAAAEATERSRLPADSKKPVIIEIKPRR